MRRPGVLWGPLMVAAGAVLALATIAPAHAGAPVAASEPVSKQQDDTAENKDSPSPWLLVPTLSSNPKLGTSLGGMGAYMHYFDPQSRA